MAGLEFGHAREDRARPRHVAESQIKAESVAVDLGAERRIGEETFELGGEAQSAAVAPPIERLLAEPVARQDEPPLLSIEEGEGEHPEAAVQGRLHTEPLAGFEQDLGVGTAT
jgi:hypothetical protein